MVALGAVLLLAAGGWVLYGSSWLRVERVRVTGAAAVTPAAAESAAAVPIGSPLISVNTDAIADRMRQKLRRIDSVDVIRAGRTDRSEGHRTQAGLLIEKGANFIEVDGGGVRFATVDKAPRGVPLLELDGNRSPAGRRFPMSVWCAKPYGCTERFLPEWPGTPGSSGWFVRLDLA